MPPQAMVASATIHHRQASCVPDASRYSTLAPAHWTCMALENARKEEGGPQQQLQSLQLRLVDGTQQKSDPLG